MNRRPLPIQPATELEIAASWANVKGRMAKPRPQWRLAWIVASIVGFVSLSAGAAVVYVQVIRRPERPAAHAEPLRRVPESRPAPLPAEPAEPFDNAVQPEPPHDDKVAPAAGEHRHRDRGHKGLVTAKPEEKPEEQVVQAPEAPPPDIFALGSQARAHGDFNRALAYYERFVDENATDPRAALAAIEACRILADHLEEPKLALVWAQRTLRLAPRGPIHEDARAREVQLLGATKATDRCLEAKSSFIRDYPTSIHTDRVNRACSAN